MLNSIKGIDLRKPNANFLAKVDSLRKGMSMEQVRRLLGNPSRETESTYGRAVWLYYRGYYYDHSRKDSVLNGSPFSLWVEFSRGKYISHRLAFSPRTTPW